MCALLMEYPCGTKDVPPRNEDYNVAILADMTPNKIAIYFSLSIQK